MNDNFELPRRKGKKGNNKRDCGVQRLGFALTVVF
jgi:hypothetical protein